MPSNHNDLEALDLSLRPAQAADAAAISALICHWSSLFMVHADGRDAGPFLQSISPSAIAGYVSDSRYRYLVLASADQLAAVVAWRDGLHLFHLFVAPAWQGKGLGGHLLAMAKEAVEAGGYERMTVNASLNAVPFYAQAGFMPAGEQVERDGVAFLPMVLTLV